MNDCFWALTNVCEGNSCQTCKKYLSINTDEGTKAEDKYWQEIRSCCSPIREKYIAMFKSYKAVE